jgi:chromosome segregation ATPase
VVNIFSNAIAAEVKRLNAEVNGIIRTHQEEVNALQKTLSMKQKKISESESNMTSIGTYVDKLEERLTSFAIKRRDMETREAKCKEIEEAAAVTETERQMLRVKVDEYSTEQEELKKILEELAIERGNLQKDNRRLLTESEFRIGEQEQMQAKCTALESEEKTLSEGVLEWRGKCEGLVPALEAAKKSNLELQSRVENMNGVEEELKVFRSQNVELQESYEKIQEELRSVRTENERLDALVNKTTESVDEQEINEGTRESVDEQEINEDTREERLEADSRKPLQPPTFPIPPSVVTRDVPFRIIRKKFSEATGIHGLLTPSSKMTRKERGPPPKMQQRPAMPHLPKTRVMPDGQIPGPPPLPQETPN